MLWLVPTRGRPDNARRLINAFAELRTLDDTELVFLLDEDDETKDDYEESVFLDGVNDDYGWLGYDIAERRRVGPTLNFYANKYAQTREHIGFMGDDHLPRTQGFDSLIRQSLVNGPVRIVYGNDLFQGSNLPTQVMMTSNIISTLGYMCPPGLTHLFLDNAWRYWGEQTNSLVYRPDVVIEHLHPQANKSEWDPLYQDVNSGEMWHHDQAEWNRYLLSGEGIQDIIKLTQLKSIA